MIDNVEIGGVRVDIEVVTAGHRRWTWSFRTASQAAVHNDGIATRSPGRAYDQARSAAERALLPPQGAAA